MQNAELELKLGSAIENKPARFLQSGRVGQFILKI